MTAARSGAAPASPSLGTVSTGGYRGRGVTERDPGWKASVDGVVSDFDQVTRHLRRRQGQALRVAWSVVGATALAMGALIGFDLLPSGSGAGPASSSAPLAQLQPGSSSSPTSSPLGVIPFPTLFPSPAPAASPSAAVTTPAPSTTHPHRHLNQVVAPVLAAVPVSPPAVLAPVTGSQPSPAPSSPSPSGGLLDGLVGGVIHGTG